MKTLSFLMCMVMLGSAACGDEEDTGAGYTADELTSICADACADYAESCGGTETECLGRCGDPADILRKTPFDGYLACVTAPTCGDPGICSDQQIGVVGDLGYHGEFRAACQERRAECGVDIVDCDGEELALFNTSAIAAFTDCLASECDRIVDCIFDNL